MNLENQCPKCKAYHHTGNKYVDSFLDKDGNCTFDPDFKCNFCNQPVGTLSMGGPQICPSCDCGYNRDGTKWTLQEAMLRYANARVRLGSNGNRKEA